MENTDNTETTAPSLAELFGMKFDENGKVTEIREIGEIKTFKRLNHQQRRVQKAIERRQNKKKLKRKI